MSQHMFLEAQRIQYFTQMQQAQQQSQLLESPLVLGNCKAVRNPKLMVNYEQPVDLFNFGPQHPYFGYQGHHQQSIDSNITAASSQQ
mmetsp:Transcript_39636/g.60689  ORF Transcript_39636/g.60689 Transcript_39636/m.60689 type:complete len:87 (+) Transcript_39636:1800-2060(+)